MLIFASYETYLPVHIEKEKEYKISSTGTYYSIHQTSYCIHESNSTRAQHSRTITVINKTVCHDKNSDKIITEKNSSEKM